MKGTANVSSCAVRSLQFAFNAKDPERQICQLVTLFAISTPTCFQKPNKQLHF